MSNFLSFPDLSNKVLLIYLRSRTPEESVVLCDVAFEVQADKVFLTGRFAEGTTPNDWAAGVSTAINWDSVEQYMIFDSLQDYMDRGAMAYSEGNVH